MEVNKIKRTQFDSCVKQISKEDKIIFITGTGGSGKTTLANKIKEYGIKVCHLDWIANKKNGQWIVDINKIDTKCKIFEGICDNIQEVMAKIKPEIVYVVEATNDELRKASKVRSQEENNLFKDEFEARSQADDSFWNAVKKEIISCVKT